MKLKELELMTGFQGKEKPGQTYKLINMSDIDNNGAFEYSSLGEIECDEVKPKYLLRKGDLIIKSRGAENTITIIDKDYENLLATAHFIIVRIGEGIELDPYYLLFYLTSKRCKDYIKGALIGTSQQILKIKSIENIELPNFPIEKQKRLGEMKRIGIEENKKFNEYVILRDKLFDAKLESLLREVSLK